LKADLASQSSLAKESRAFKKKVESQVEEMATLKAQLAQTKSSLEEAQAQNKTLATKLVANRSAAASVESVNTKGQGSTVTANGGIRIMGTAEAAQVAQAAQLKEDLYSDLTGLIIRGVKREADDDIFDCIQTGRNGSKSLSPPDPQPDTY
jgi:predicted ribosome quality control (RQC) complex YloA/Tae2 family protein